jgi:hypothetical protein
MKIPLDVRAHSGGLKPFATIHFQIPTQKVRGSTVHGLLWAFVDTGSPFTIVSEIDSRRLRIQTYGTPREIKLGGAPLYSYELKNTIFKVVCEDKKTICNISLPSIGVIRPIPKVKRSIEVSRSIPSIIGMDLLLVHRLALYFDPTNKSSYLERV